MMSEVRLLRTMPHVEPAEMLADSTPKSLFLGSLQSGVVTKNKDLRSLARFIVLAFQQAPQGSATVDSPGGVRAPLRVAVKRDGQTDPRVVYWPNNAVARPTQTKSTHGRIYPRYEEPK